MPCEVPSRSPWPSRPRARQQVLARVHASLRRRALSVCLRISLFGHPRLYATWRDETLNALLANLAEASHPTQFERGVFLRLDLQAALGIGVARPVAL